MEVIDCGKRTVQTQCLFEALFFLVLQREMCRILQQQPAGSLEDFHPGALSLPLQFPAKFGQFAIEQFAEMKMVKNDYRLRCDYGSAGTFADPFHLSLLPARHKC